MISKEKKHPKHAVYDILYIQYQSKKMHHNSIPLKWNSTPLHSMSGVETDYTTTPKCLGKASWTRMDWNGVEKNGEYCNVVDWNVVELTVIEWRAASQCTTVYVIVRSSWYRQSLRAVTDTGM